MLREQESEIEKMIMEYERLRMENLKLKELLKRKKEKNKEKKWRFCRNCKRSVRISHECTVKVKLEEKKSYERSFGEFECDKCMYSTGTIKGLNNHKRKHKKELEKQNRTQVS